MLHTKIIDSKKEKILILNAEKFISNSKFGASIYFLGSVRNIMITRKLQALLMIAMMKWLLKVLKKFIMKLIKN